MITTESHVEVTVACCDYRAKPQPAKEDVPSVASGTVDGFELDKGTVLPGDDITVI